MGEPPVKQSHRLAFDVFVATRQVATWVIVQGLACSLMSERHSYTLRECTVKCLDVARRSGNEHTGAHRDDRIDVSLDQACGHTTEDIIQRSHSTLAGIENGQAYPAVLQDLCQFLSRDKLLLALFIFEGEHALLQSAALEAQAILWRLLLAERTVPIKLHHMHRRKFEITETLTQGWQSRGT